MGGDVVVDGIAWERGTLDDEIDGVGFDVDDVEGSEAVI